MTVHIAFLRAINIGGRTVKMDHLRSLFESLGYGEVETFIASGNVIFQSPDEDTRALEQQIEAHLRQALGYEVATFLSSRQQQLVAASIWGQAVECGSISSKWPVLGRVMRVQSSPAARAAAW
jgi:uncharacterized protein (DUF1697 family)